MRNKLILALMLFVMFILLASFVSAETPLGNGLMYYPFQIDTDSIANLSNVFGLGINYEGFYAGIIGDSVNLTDAGDNMLLNKTLDSSIMAEFGTIDGWFKPSVTANYHPLYEFTGADGSPYTNGFHVQLTASNNLRLEYYVASSSKCDVTGSAVLTAGTWNHVVTTYSPDNGFKVYVNTVLDITCTDTTPLPTIENLDTEYSAHSDNLCVSLGRCYEGLIDNLYVTDLNYTVADVIWAYNGGAGRNYTVVDDTTPPIITQINFTSDGGEICVWPTLCGPTEDTDPTFVLSIDESSRCRCGYQDVGYDSMPTDATGNDTTELTCTQASSAPFGFNISYFACVDTLGNNNTAPLENTSKANLSIQDLTAPNINFTAPTPPNGTNITYGSIFANVTASDNFILVQVNISLYNLTDYVSSFVNTTADLFQFNFTSLQNATYFLNATASDADSGIPNSTETRQYFLVAPAAPSDSCTYTSGDWIVSCSDNCLITNPVDLGGNNIIITGTGTFDSNVAITNYNLFRVEGTDSSNICSVRFTN